MSASAVFDKVAVFERAAALPRLGSILVHASTSRASAALTVYAAELANLYGARLIGVSSDGQPGESRPSEVEEAARGCLLEAAGAQFADLTRSVRAGVGWACSEGSPSAALAAHAWAADLIVVGAREPGIGERGGDLKRLVAGVDGPVLLSPKSQTRPCFDRVAVVWSDRSACRRAFASALPFIGKAKEVFLISTGRPMKVVQHGLALRGVKAQIGVLEGSATWSARLEQLREAAPDLLVFGWPQLLGTTILRDPIERAIANRHSAVLLRT